jgi:hypothetical protein
MITISGDSMIGVAATFIVAAIGIAIHNASVIGQLTARVTEIEDQIKIVTNILTHLTTTATTRQGSDPQTDITPQPTARTKQPIAVSILRAAIRAAIDAGKR